MREQTAAFPRASSDSDGLRSSASPLPVKTALVTGASRGIGASVARQLGRIGVDVAVNYRSKRPKAQGVADELIAMGRSPLLIQADITNAGEIETMFEKIREAWTQLDLLVLNASGGLEQDRAADYAMQLNLRAQVDLVLASLPLMQRGSRIVFVTSHLAHFHGTGAGYNSYEKVAESKRAGETALREMIPSLSSREIRLVVVSGDLIEGTITPKLLERQCRGLIENRRRAVGSLPSIEEFAAAIVQAGMSNEYSSGDTIYIGSTEWGSEKREFR